MVKSKKKIKSIKSIKKVEPVRANTDKTRPLYEYDIAMRTHERRAALTTSAKFWGTLKTLKQLNSIREAQQWNPRAHEIMTRDLEFLQKTYQRAKIE